MENYVVSARKYRPDTFETVVGQEHITGTLRNALKLGQLSHAFLFCGPRGVGKTTCARILAKAVNCQNLTPNGDPCNTCASCISFNENRSLNIFELDAASNNSVDDIRSVIDQLRYIPQSGSRSVYIIDEVHMLTTAAFNAFLKTLEEPPPHALFILATTEKHKILPTILSRCQKFDFKRIRVNEIADYLKTIAERETVAYEYDALQLIALKADGGMRDALSIFDQMVNFSRRNVSYTSVLENLNVLDYDYFFKVIDGMKAGNHTALLLLLNEVIDRGYEGHSFLSGLLEHFRNLLVAADPATVELLELNEQARKRYLQQASTLPPGILLHAFHLCSVAEAQYKTANNARLLIELLLFKLAHLTEAFDLVELKKKDD
jgi:DNA polymerase-3 subunit gamma/tau